MFDRLEELATGVRLLLKPMKEITGGRGGGCGDVGNGWTKEMSRSRVCPLQGFYSPFLSCLSRFPKNLVGFLAHSLYLITLVNE